jgi:hypothetical protein
MLPNTLGFAFAAAISLLSLPANLPAQDSQQALALTPFGYRDRAHVHKIPPGYGLVVMPDGHMRAENAITGNHIDFADSVETDARLPWRDNGWVTYASWKNNTGTPVSSFTTTWTVPPAPAAYHGQTLFQFNSIEPSSYKAILQPVLQYGESEAGGGEYWAVASWYVTGNNAYYSSLVTVSTGDTLTGVIKLSSSSGKKFNYTCEFTGIAETNFPITNIAQLTWCTETLEVYGVHECTEFPNTAYSEMLGIELQTGDKVPTVKWAPTDAKTHCGVKTTIVTNGGSDGAVRIDY